MLHTFKSTIHDLTLSVMTERCDIWVYADSTDITVRTWKRSLVYDLSFPSSVAYLDVLLSQQNLCRNTEDNNTNTPRRVH